MGNFPLHPSEKGVEKPDKLIGNSELHQFGQDLYSYKLILAQAIEPVKPEASNEHIAGKAVEDSNQVKDVKEGQAILSDPKIHNGHLHNDKNRHVVNLKNSKNLETSKVDQLLAKIPFNQYNCHYYPDKFLDSNYKPAVVTQGLNALSELFYHEKIGSPFPTDGKLKSYNYALYQNAFFLDSNNSHSGLDLKPGDIVCVIDPNKPTGQQEVHAENYNLRGMAHSFLKEYEKSIVDYTKAIELLTSQNKTDPNISSYYVNRSQLYRDINKVGEAIRDLKIAIEIYPDHPNLYYTLALIDDENLDDYEAALKNINLAISLDSRQITYYSLRGQIYEHLGKPDKAIAEFKEEINRVPKFYAGYYQLGRLYLKIGQNDKAKEYFEKAIEQGPQDYELYHDIGAQYNLYDNNLKALEYFNKSLKIKPNADAYCGKAIISDNRLINYQAALHNINLAIKLNPNVAQYYQVRGYIYNNLGQTKKAR